MTKRGKRIYWLKERYTRDELDNKLRGLGVEPTEDRRSWLMFKLRNRLTDAFNNGIYPEDFEEVE